MQDSPVVLGQYMTFLIFLKHFHGNVKSSKKLPYPILIDNHGLHLFIDVLNFYKSNGIILLFPPHTSHLLQPLDKSIFGPFKKFYFTAADNWMSSNPGKTITIYDISKLVSNAFRNAMIPNNIVAGFLATGLMPYNPDAFKDEVYFSS